MRDRDATSFGVRNAPLTAAGVALMGGGAGAAGAQFFDLAGAAKRVPVNVLPWMCEGGAGIAIKLKW